MALLIKQLFCRHLPTLLIEAKFEELRPFEGRSLFMDLSTKQHATLNYSYAKYRCFACGKEWQYDANKTALKERT